jgi:hypothetical protein
MFSQRTKLALLTSALSGCALTIQYTPMKAPPRAMVARTPDKIDVLNLPPGRGYVEVGTFDVEQPGTIKHDDVVVALRKDAAQRGCDGIVILSDLQSGKLASCVVYTDQ